MHLPTRADKLELRGKQLRDLLSVTTHDRQLAALFRAVACEAADDRMTTGRDSAGGNAYVGIHVLWLSQEMKSRPIMPEVDAAGIELNARDVTCDPSHA